MFCVSIEELNKTVLQADKAEPGKFLVCQIPWQSVCGQQIVSSLFF